MCWHGRCDASLRAWRKTAMRRVSVPTPGTGWAVESLELGASKFETAVEGCASITRLFKRHGREGGGGGHAQGTDVRPRSMETGDVQADNSDGGVEPRTPRVGRALGATDASEGADKTLTRPSHAVASDVEASPLVSGESRDRSVDGRSQPPGTDAEVWAALPAAVRRELLSQMKLEAMLAASDGRGGGPAQSGGRRSSGNSAQTLHRYFKLPCHGDA